MQSLITQSRIKHNRRFAISLFFVSFLASIFVGCGEGKSSSTKVNAPSSLGTFRTLTFVGSATEFINIIGDTTGVYSRSITTESIDGATVSMTLSGNFVYEKTSNNDGKLILGTVSVSFIGGLNTVVTPSQAEDFIGKPVDLTEEFQLKFAETPLNDSNVGTYKAIKTTTSGTQSVDSGTFEFGFTPGVTSTKLATN